jgi:nicotinamidase-related amidase
VATRDQFQPLPVPPHFDSRNAARWDYSPNVGRLAMLADEWRETHQIPSGASGGTKVELLIVDAQKDFCFPEGTLYVGGRSGRGAIDDSVRLAEFIYRNLDRISGITTTMDSHLPYQIFFTSFWLDADGGRFPEYTVVSTDMVASGMARPNPALADWLAEGDYAWLRDQAEFYCRELERTGKYQLTLWPYHGLLGTEGHALAGVIAEACLFHSFVWRSQLHVEVKGTHPLTEHYSVLNPEVLLSHDGRPLATKSTALLQKLHAADALIVAGQAASHCVRWTIDDIYAEIRASDPAAAGRITILRDCSSAVAVPDGRGGFLADYTDETEAAYARFEAEGMHVVDSAGPISTWDWLHG